MKNTILFCENRNKFFKGESNGTTHWTSDGSLARKFNGYEAMMKISLLKRMIIDSHHIKSVNADFKKFS